VTVEIRRGKTVEASGDTVDEALWELKRNRPGDHIYPAYRSIDSTEITGVDVRPHDDEMKIIKMTVVTK
jgi:hypothetical protein